MSQEANILSLEFLWHHIEHEIQDRIRIENVH